jgi:ATP-dependent helicase/nuclease subunit B
VWVRYNGEMSRTSSRSQENPDTWTERELLQTIRDNAGALVVTGNVRAARALRQRYNGWQHAAGNAGWTTPPIQAWEAWLQNLWNSAVLCGIETRVLLSDVQELELWHKIIARDEAARFTFSVRSLAELAQSAWKEMQRHGIALRSLYGDSSVDVQAFYRWAMEFERLCRASSFLSASRLETAAVEWLSTDKIALPEQIFLLGFDRVTPAQAALIRALVANSCAVHQIALRPGGTAGDPVLVYTCTQQEEIAAAAHWIRNRLIANPSQRIGVIVPALAEVRDTIDTIFRHILAPSSMDIRATQAALPYEFSLGTRMQRIPDIRTALTLLRWLQGPMPAEEISWLLVHGGFGGRANDATGQVDGAAQDRAKLDRKFRDRKFQLGGPVSLGAFRQWLSGLGNGKDPTPLRRSIERLFAAWPNESLDRMRSFAEWREAVEEMLTTADWHLLKPVASREYQLLKRWDSLLDDLSSFNVVSEPVKFDAVFDQLRHLAAHTLFTLESRNAPIQILGISESAGLTFDSVWWMNARADVWPARGNALPLIPWNVQRAAAMPYADPAEDYAFALGVTERILGSANYAIVSFALEESEPGNSSVHVADREVILSPLIREVFPKVPMTAVDEFVPAQSVATQNSRPADLESVHEEAALPFQSAHVVGGISFLELHAACPFRAFAELRLATRPLEKFSEGLSPNDQGIVMHRALHRFWDEMKTQEDLLASSTEQLRQKIRKHIADALKDFVKAASEPWQKALLEIESDRLEARLMDWLEQEKNRSSFRVIATEDLLKDRRLGGIEVDCRIDRIDQVEQGIVLLDYKAGVVDRNSCEGDRPDNPQLPAYAVLRADAADQPLAGVAYAGLHLRKVGFTVISSLPSVFEASSQAPSPESQRDTERRSKSRWNPSGLSPEEMKLQQEVWDATLTRIAENFRNGAAAVDPKNADETCRFCAQGLLCRVRETMAAMAGLPDPEEGEDLSGRPSHREDFSS